VPVAIHRDEDIYATAVGRAIVGTGAVVGVFVFAVMVALLGLVVLVVAFSFNPVIIIYVTGHQGEKQVWIVFFTKAENHPGQSPGLEHKKAKEAIERGRQFAKDGHDLLHLITGEL
jgi:hypothetical protein